MTDKNGLLAMMERRRRLAMMRELEVKMY